MWMQRSTYTQPRIRKRQDGYSKARPPSPPGKAPGTHFIGGWVDPRTSLDIEWRKISTPSNNRDQCQAVQPRIKSLAVWATWTVIKYWQNMCFIDFNLYILSKYTMFQIEYTYFKVLYCPNYWSLCHGSVIGGTNTLSSLHSLPRDVSCHPFCLVTITCFTSM